MSFFKKEKEINTYEKKKKKKKKKKGSYQKKMAVEFKTARKLLRHLPNSVDKLQEYGGPLLVVGVSICLSVPLRKFVSKS